MNIYLLTGGSSRGDDTYDSVVVCAENEADAKTIHPSGRLNDEPKTFPGTWVHQDKVDVQFLGQALYSIKRGVILASFNAG